MKNPHRSTVHAIRLSRSAFSTVWCGMKRARSAPNTDTYTTCRQPACCAACTNGTSAARAALLPGSGNSRNSDCTLSRAAAQVSRSKKSKRTASAPFT